MTKWPCIVVAALSLPTFAASASAECAWVLWMTVINYDTTGKATNTATVRMTGAESKTNCLTLLKATIRDKIAGAEARTTIATAGDYIG